MTIEIRQLQITTTVGSHMYTKAAAEPGEGMLEQQQLKEDILDECKQWLKEYLRELEQR